MSTEIKSNEPHGVRVATLRLSKDMSSVVVNSFVRVSRADFLAAVAAECDVIIVRRADLPVVNRHAQNVTVDGLYRTIDREFKDYTAKHARETGLRLFALAEYLDAHPPVDEAQVKALSDILHRDAGWSPELSGDTARTLIATGKVTVTR